MLFHKTVKIFKNSENSQIIIVSKTVQFHNKFRKYQKIIVSKFIISQNIQKHSKTFKIVNIYYLLKYSKIFTFYYFIILYIEKH